MAVLTLILWGLSLVVLSAWGVVQQRLTVRIERAHPAWFQELFERNRRSFGRRLAVTAELQGILRQSDATLPESVLADPVAATLIIWERRLLTCLWPLVLGAFVVIAAS